MRPRPHLVLNQKDVLDDTYRKAGKLNAEDFATKLDVVKAGLVDAVRYNLFEGVQSKNIVRAELYKLNVYGWIPSMSRIIRD